MATKQGQASQTPSRTKKTPGKTPNRKPKSDNSKRNKKDADERKKEIIREKALRLLDGELDNPDDFNEIRDEVALMSKGDYATFISYAFLVLDQADDKIQSITKLLYEREMDKEGIHLIINDEDEWFFTTANIKGFYESKKIATRALRMVIRSTKKRQTKMGGVLVLKDELTNYFKIFQQDMPTMKKTVDNADNKYELLKSGLAHRTTIVHILNAIGTYKRGMGLRVKIEENLLPEEKYFAVQHKFMSDEKLAEISRNVAKFKFNPTENMKKAQLAGKNGAIKLKSNKMIAEINNSDINSIISSYSSPLKDPISEKEKASLRADNEKALELKETMKSEFYDVIVHSKKIADTASRQLNKKASV